MSKQIEAISSVKVVLPAGTDKKQTLDTLGNLLLLRFHWAN